MSKYDKKELTQLILIEKLSYVEIGKRYGVSGQAIKKAAIRFGIELPVRRKINEKETFGKGVYKKEREIGHCINCGKEFIKYKEKENKYCSFKCQQEYQYKEYIKKWQNGEIDGLTSNGFNLSDRIRRYIFEKYDCKCDICKQNYINEYTGLSILQIHHKDGNISNTSEDNLQLLCPNHHAMTENFGSRNKNGNHNRTLYYNRAKQ